MSLLQSKSALIVRAQRMLLCITAVIVLAFYALAYRPTTRDLARLQALTVARQQELSANQSKASRRNEIAGKNEKLRQELDQIRKPSRQQELPDLIKELTLLSQQNSLRKFNYRPGTPTPSELFLEYPMTLTFEGDGTDAFNFLRMTEQLPRLTRIRSVSLKSRDNHAGSVQAQVVANIYFSNE